MAKRNLNWDDMNRELAEWHERFPRLKDDDLFVAWFLRAFITENEEEAANSLTGGSGDKDVDAVFVDDATSMVFLVQGKYRKSVGSKSESRNDVRSFAELAQDICGDSAEFQDRLEGANPVVVKRLKEARARVLKRNYDLRLFYVTMGRISEKVRQEGEALMRPVRERAELDLLDGNSVLLMLGDYLDGVAPPIPTLDLPMEAGDGMKTSGALVRFDPKTQIESWIFSMSAGSIADLYTAAGPRLFARNVRGFLGNTDINSGMHLTLVKKPRYFWYYNNGITVVCDRAEQVRSAGKDILRVWNPQVINGQQTTRVLHEARKNCPAAGVLVRVIKVPRGDQGNVEFDELVSNIVQATNWQNAIRPSDLMSNDRRQIELERQLKKANYNYIRKRQTKREARSNSSRSFTFFIKKEEFAQAVAACDMDSSVMREGKERLFEEHRYGTVFPTSDPDYYLPRYWLMRLVGAAARGYPERAYAKWLVLHFVWKDVKKLVRSKAGNELFVNEAEIHGPSTKSLLRCIDTTFRAAIRFYRAKRGAGERATDVSSFFRKHGLDREFERFWRSRENTQRARYRKRFTKYQTDVRKMLRG